MGASPSPAVPRSFQFDLTPSVLAGDGAVGVEITTQADGDVANALLTNGPFPDRDITLGNAAIRAEAGKTIKFNSDRGAVSFNGSGSAFAALAVHSDPGQLLQQLSFDQGATLGLEFAQAADERFLVLSWGYDARAAAKGSVALGVGAAVNFGAEASREALYAVVRRIQRDAPSRDALQSVVAGWRLPSQVDSVANLDPGTYLVTEVDGSVGLKLGAQFGYDFNWVREIERAGLSGDIGLKLQLGAAVALGFHASGNYALVISRDILAAADQTLRLRLFKLSKKGWDFAFNSGATVTLSESVLPEGPDEFIAAVFGVHGSQIVKTLQALEKWTASDKDLPDLLAELGVDYGKRLLQEVTNLDPQQRFEEAHARLLGAFAKWNELPNTAAAELWSLVGELKEKPQELQKLRDFVKGIADGDPTELNALLTKSLQSVSFFSTPSGRWLQSFAAGRVLSLVDDAPRLKQAAGLTAGVLDGSIVEDVLKRLQRYIEKNLKLDRVLEVVSETDFQELDKLLKLRLADFLDEKLEALDLEKIKLVQQTIRLVIDKRKTFYEKARKALNRQYEFSFAAAYQKATSRTALLDIEFDFAQGNGDLSALLKAAINGDFDTIFLKETKGVTLNKATLSHDIGRQSYVDVSLPFYKSRIDHINRSLATAGAIDEEDGRVVVYELDAEDRVTAKNKQDSRLAVAANLPLRLSEGVRTYGELSSSYSYAFQQAKKNMKRAELQYQLKPYVETYFSSSFEGHGQRSLDEWIGDLDKQIDDIEANGPQNFGNTLISLELSYPSNVLAAWLQAPADKKDRAYMDMSRALQRKLKELIPFYYFQDPENYKTLGAASPLLVYAAMPPSTDIRLRNGQLTLNTDDDVYWDWKDSEKRSAMIHNDRTRDKLSRDLQRVCERLKNLGDAKTSDHYKEGQLGSFLSAAGSGNGETLMQSLLFVEAEVVAGAHKAALEMAKFIAQGTEKPSKAIESLAEFGSKVTKAFNSSVSSVYGKGALRPLGPMLLVEAARALDPRQMPQEPNAMLSLTVLKKELDFPPQGFPNHEIQRRSLVPGEGPVVIEERLVRLGTAQA